MIVCKDNETKKKGNRKQTLRYSLLSFWAEVGNKLQTPDKFPWLLVVLSNTESESVP